MATSVISDNANTFFDILPHETTLYGTYDDTRGHLVGDIQGDSTNYKLEINHEESVLIKFLDPNLLYCII